MMAAAEEEAAPLSGVGWAAGPEAAPAGWSVVRWEAAARREAARRG